MMVTRPLEMLCKYSSRHHSGFGDHLLRYLTAKVDLHVVPLRERHQLSCGTRPPVPRLSSRE